MSRFAMTFLFGVLIYLASTLIEGGLVYLVLNLIPNDWNLSYFQCCLLSVPISFVIWRLAPKR